MNELVSIIVPIYNVEKYLKRCVDSVIHSSYKQIEIILVDDGSTDSSGQIADEYKKIDSRIIVIHKKNGGLSDARNTGIKVATGKYITFVDSDDWIESNIYEYCLNKNKDIDADIIIFSIQIDYLNGDYSINSIQEEKVLNNEEGIVYLNTFKNLDFSSCNKLYKKELFDKINFPVGKLCEDCYIMNNLFYNSKKILILPVVGYHYFKREGSITRNSKINYDYLFAFKYQKEFIDTKLPQIKKVGNSSYAFANIAIFNEHLMRKNYDNLGNLLKEARKFKKDVITLKELPIKKKIQFILFIYFNHIYISIFNLLNSRKIH